MRKRRLAISPVYIDLGELPDSIRRYVVGAA